MLMGLILKKSVDISEIFAKKKHFNWGERGNLQGYRTMKLEP
jgi:hypothetical protein